MGRLFETPLCVRMLAKSKCQFLPLALLDYDGVDMVVGDCSVFFEGGKCSALVEGANMTSKLNLEG